jgi:hypothetical protein
LSCLPTCLNGPLFYNVLVVKPDPWLLPFIIKVSAN